MAGLLLDQDVIWVGGGSVANLLAIWRLHGLDMTFSEVWQAGVVLAGVSAGSVCWHVGGTTDSFGPDLRPVTDGLALLPYSNGVHYDSEPQRRPVFQQLIAEGVLPDGYATDDGRNLSSPEPCREPAELCSKLDLASLARTADAPHRDGTSAIRLCEFSRCPRIRASGPHLALILGHSPSRYD